MQVVLDVFDKNNNFQQKNISYHFMIFEKNSSWFLKWSIGHPCIHRSFSICVYFQRTHTYTLIQIWPRHRTNKHWLEILIAEQEGVDSGFHVFNISFLQCPSWACVEQEERENKLTKVWVEGLQGSLSLRSLDWLLRSEVNGEFNFCPNFEGLVLGCIDGNFCK